MEIKSLHLVGHKYFQFVEIEDLLVEIRNKIQLIVGINGSNKTTLMKSYSPYPPVSSLFFKTGYKELVITHEGHEYTLGYDAASKLHSFKQDGTELNESGTAAIQEELVVSHLGYTKLIDKLIYHRMRMTQMTPAARMDFLISINPVNIKFLKDRYVKIVSQSKKVKAQIEYLQRKISEYKSIMMDQETYDRYLADQTALQALDSDVVKLIYRYQTLDAQLTQTGELTRPVESYRELYTRLIHCRTHLTQIEDERYRDQSIESLSLLQSQYARDIETLQTRMTTLAKEIDELDALIARSSTVDLTELETRYRDQLETLARYPDFTTHTLIHWPPKEESDRAYSALHRLREISDSLGILYSGPIWTSKKYQWHRDRLRRLIGQRDALARRLQECEAHCTRLETQLTDLQSSGPDRDCVSIVCPFRVQHTGLVQQSTTDISTCRQDIAAIQQRYRQILHILSLYSHFFEYQNTWHGPHGVLQEILATIRTISPELLTLYPYGTDSIAAAVNASIQSVISTVTQCLQHSQDYTEYLALSKATKELQVTIEAHKKDMSIAYMQRRRVEALQDYTRYSQECQASQRECADIQRYISLQSRLQDTITQTGRYVADLERDVSLTETLARHAAYSSTIQQLDELHRHLSVYLREMDSVVKDQSRYRALYQTQQRDIETLSTQLSDLLVMESVLNPYTGLPSVYTKHHISSILKNVNYFISQVMTYPLSVHLVEDTKELKYKFMVQVDKIQIGDISNCSDGQMEIIDLAFTLAIMIAMKLHTTHPVFLDEIGRCLDATHAQRLLEMLHSLVAQGYIHQLFLINHQAMLIGGFDTSTTDIVCLRGENMVLPETYNETVTIA